MPIRLQCTCGKALAVKDEFAGKTVKCPGCQAGIRVPTAAPGATKARPAQTAGTQPDASKAPAPAANFGGLDDLFDEEGIQQHTGPLCPSCSKPLKAAGAIMCTHCGVNFQTGQRATSHNQAVAAAPTLGHYQLDEAVETMKSDAALQKRTGNAGMPWWFLLTMLVFLGSFCFALVTIVDAAGATSETTGLARTIREYAANQNIVWGCIITGLVIQLIIHIWVFVLSFK